MGLLPTYLDQGFNQALQRGDSFGGGSATLPDGSLDIGNGGGSFTGGSVNGTANLVEDQVQPSELASGDIAEHLVIAADGHIRGGADDYLDGDGFWLGSYQGDKNDYRFFIGDSTGNYLSYANGVLTVSGAIAAGTIDIGGADATSFHVDANGNMWLGAATFDIATNPFAVSSAGAMRAISGAIGAWNITATNLRSGASDAASNILLDPTNSVLRLGATSGNYLNLDGANLRIRSSNYVAGMAGSGFTLEPNLLEVGNISARGLLRTYVLQKDILSVNAGSLLVTPNADVLDADMTASDSAVALLDSYDESNASANIQMSSTLTTKSAQSFTGESGNLSSVKFYLAKTGSPTGNAVAKLYAHSGTYGVNGVPTGTALATSGNVDVSTFSTDPTYALVTFTFSGAEQYPLVAGTHYFISFEYSGGNNFNYLRLARDNSSPTATGNFAFLAGSWTSSTDDLIYYIYSVPTNLTIKGTATFAVGDLLRIKDSTNDEWMQVTAAAAPVYTVDRDKAAAYASNSNPTWTKGATVANYGQSGQGGLYLTASDTGNPYLSVFTHAGSPWSTMTTRLRIGNLNGYLGYVADTYGFGVGDSSGTNANITIDPTNGIRIRNGVTNVMTLDNAGNATFTGSITAASGAIGGFTIGATTLSAASGGNTTTLSSGSTAFSAGPTGSPTVTITQGGAVTATNIDISTSVTLNGSALTATGNKLSYPTYNLTTILQQDSGSGISSTGFADDSSDQIAVGSRGVNDQIWVSTLGLSPDIGGGPFISYVPTALDGQTSLGSNDTHVIAIGADKWTNNVTDANVFKNGGAGSFSGTARNGPMGVDLTNSAMLILYSTTKIAKFSGIAGTTLTNLNTDVTLDTAVTLTGFAFDDLNNQYVCIDATNNLLRKFDSSGTTLETVSYTVSDSTLKGVALVDGIYYLVLVSVRSGATYTCHMVSLVPTTMLRG